MDSFNTKTFTANPLVWPHIRDFLSNLKDTKQRVVNTSSDPVEIYRAQGYIQGLDRILKQYEVDKNG